MGSRSPHGKAQFSGEKGHPTVKYRDTVVICAKPAELIEMPFELWARMGHRNCVRLGSRAAEGRCHGNNFGTKIAINWLCVNDSD